MARGSQRGVATGPLAHFNVRQLLILLAVIVLVAVVSIVYVFHADFHGSKEDRSMLGRVADVDPDFLLVDGASYCPPCPVCPFTVLDAPGGADIQEVEELIETQDKSQLAQKTRSEWLKAEHLMDISAGTAMDRMFQDTVKVDLSYTLSIAESHWQRTSQSHSPAAASPSYATVMAQLHGADMWKDPKMQAMMKLLEIKPSDKDIFGSTMELGVMSKLIKDLKPRLLVEVGVFRGSTSIKMAQMLDSMPELKNSFIISIDTWLLDLRFVWSAPDKGTDSDPSAVTGTRYFKNAYVAGGSHMYYMFLGNVMHTNTQHRIIPLQTTSSNGAMALVAHRLRPELVYVDASHANPDVFLDLENYYALLAPGGAIAMDDYQVPAVQTAIHALVDKHGLELHTFNDNTQAYIIKPSSAA